MSTPTVVTATAATTGTVEHFNRLDSLGYTVKRSIYPARPLAALLLAVQRMAVGSTVRLPFVNPETQTVEFTLVLDCDEDRLVRISEDPDAE